MEEQERKKIWEVLQDGESAVIFADSSLMDILLDSFDSYLATVENFLDKKILTAEKAHEELKREGYIDMEEQLFVTKVLFTNLLRSSFLVAAYSVIETGLQSRCGCIAKIKNLSIELYRYSKRGYIHKYWKFLKEYGGVDSSGINEWKELPTYGEMRNRVVHYQGKLDPKNIELDKFIKGQPDLLGVDKDNTIIFKKGFCEKVIETIRNFFQSLDSQLPTDCQDVDQNFGFQ